MGDYVRWMNHKDIDIEEVNRNIAECLKTRCFSNNGKFVQTLQDNIKKLFDIDDDKDVLAVCNGSSGLNALVGGLNIHYERNLRWAVQAFTFPCSHQGLLRDSLVLDIDENMGPSLQQLAQMKSNYDGVIVTNCFGTCVNIALYEQFCKENNKLLLFDNAACSYTRYDDKSVLNYGVGCMVSLHHTKPIGIGEGGFIVFDKVYTESMKKAICFGYTDDNKWLYDANAGNYKMSEVAAIYILSYLPNVFNIYQHHRNIVSYFNDCIKNNNKIKYTIGVNLLDNYADHDASLLSCLPVVFPKPIDINIFLRHGVEAKKYYYPISESCKRSLDLYNRIICLPLNTDTDFKCVDRYISIIRECTTDI